MQKFKIQIIVGNIYEVDIIARNILEANELALELDEDSDMTNVDEVDRCVYSSQVIDNEAAAVLYTETPSSY